jgi:hypothetical protein
VLLFVLGAGSVVPSAQWLNYPTPGIPRLPTGAPNLQAPAPRTPDGKPDFSGMWFANTPSRDFCKEKDCIQEERMAREQINLGITLKDGLPYTEWSREQMKTRRANGGREDPHAYCMPPNFPRAWTLPQHNRIVQTPGMMVVLHEFNAAYREIYLDGRPLPVNPNPTWNGYSTGHWEGDTLVIETNGIRDDMWLDIQGSPVTAAARVTERLTRVKSGSGGRGHEGGMAQSARVDLRGRRQRQGPDGELELRAAEPGDADAPWMDARLVEARRPRHGHRRASQELPHHRHRQLHSG